MLFDRSPLTPEQQTEVLMRHFGRVSGADAGPHEGSCVPLSVLEVNPARMVSLCLDTLCAALAAGTSGHVVIPKLTAELIPGRSCGES